MPTPHTSVLNFTSCSSSGKVIKFDSPYNDPPDLINAQLNHYQYKSFEEYCLKIKKGIADRPKNIGNEIVKQQFKSLYSQIKNNEEKLKILNKIFNFSLN